MDITSHLEALGEDSSSSLPVPATIVPLMQPESALVLNITQCQFPLAQNNASFVTMGNCSAIDCSTVRYKHEGVWTNDVIQRVAMLTIIMTLTLFGNTIIIIVLTCSKYRRMNSRVNIFIINLAIGDLSVCGITMTTEILFVVFGEWVLGGAACKILLYGQTITLASTTFILTTMSFDRYLAICRPLNFGVSTRSRAKKMILVAWAMAFLFALPQLLIFKQVVEQKDGCIYRYKCLSKGYTAYWQRKTYITFMTTYILVIPATFISFCYINVAKVVWRQGKEVTSSKHDKSSTLRRSCMDMKAIPRAKIKTIKMTLSIIVLFISCWTPYFVTNLVNIWSHYKYKIPTNLWVWVETIALLNSAVNPILYGFFNIKIKRGLMEVFCPARLRPEGRISLSMRSGITECTAVPNDGDLCLPSSKKHTRKYRHNSYSNSSSSSANYKVSVDSDSKCLFTGLNSTGKSMTPQNSKGKNHIIAEENSNGFRYKVKFTKSKEGVTDRDNTEASDTLLGDNQASDTMLGDNQAEQVMDVVTSI